MNKNLPMPPSSRILFVSAMFVIVSVSFATLVGYGFTLRSPRVAEKPKVGVVNGVVYSPGSSSAVVDVAIVREGDVIGDVAVVAIQDNAVAFSKAGVTWQQEVLETPNEAWKQTPVADSQTE